MLPERLPTSECLVNRFDWVWGGESLANCGLAPATEAGSPRERSETGLRRSARCLLMQMKWTQVSEQAGAQKKTGKLGMLLLQFID